MSDAEDRGHERRSRAWTPRDAPPIDYRAVVEEYDDAPDECTIFPRSAKAESVTTEWITAREGSFVALADVR
jgi:hypothetical protein